MIKKYIRGNKFITITNYTLYKDFAFGIKLGIDKPNLYLDIDLIFIGFTFWLRGGE